MRSWWIGALLCVFACNHCLAATEVIVWERNLNNPFLKTTLQNLLELTNEDFEQVKIVPSEKMEQGRAFSELIKGNIDIFIAAADSRREALANPIYVPLDRGLLGFRVCLINKQSSRIKAVSSLSEFQEKKLTVGSGTHWPDTQVFQANGFSVVTSPVLSSLFNMLKNQRYDCLSRSVNEINKELLNLKDTDIIAEDRLLFIYPNADFIFVSPENPRLHRRLSYGIGRSLENNSYYEIFDQFFEKILVKHGIYHRKLIILNNEQISPKALSAINRFGIASFSTDPSQRLDTLR